MEKCGIADAPALAAVNQRKGRKFVIWCFRKCSKVII